MNPIAEQEMPVFEDSPAEIETANEQVRVDVKTAKEELELDYSYFPFLFEIPKNIPYQELTDEEVLTLADKAGTFDFLNDRGEDIYNPSEVIEVRNIPLAQIKKEVLSLLSDGKTKYIDEIAEKLNLDFIDVTDAFNQLQEEGKLFIDENKL
jgi:hypothetical protein